MIFGTYFWFWRNYIFGKFLHYLSMNPNHTCMWPMICIRCQILVFGLSPKLWLNPCPRSQEFADCETLSTTNLTYIWQWIVNLVLEYLTLNRIMETTNPYSILKWEGRWLSYSSSGSGLSLLRHATKILMVL